MKPDFDVNMIAAEFIKSNIDEIYSTTKGFFKEATDNIHLRLERTYREYVTDLLSKYGTTKSFFIRGRPVPLYKFYIPLSLKMDDKTLSGPGISEIVKTASNVIIFGSAGCGKSMLFRHLLIDCLENKMRIPIFIELRQFNSFEGSLLDLVHKTLNLYKFRLDEEYVEKALLAGHFVLILDGFDEIIRSKREMIRGLISVFSIKFDKNVILMSSRPDTELEGWHLFSIAHICPLNKQQAVDLVAKLPFDEQIKAKFMTELGEELFEEHESFLSNPLLLSIMLLSYGQSATIPRKLSIFYNQAYEALFERHDILKDGFTREIQCGLDIHDFAKIFSAFSIITYDERSFEFSDLEALDTIQRSQEIAGLNFGKTHYLNDLIQSTCLLVRDGIFLTYTHRSFQEYFAARFISELRGSAQKELAAKYVEYAEVDNMLSMLYEIKPEVVEEYLILPWLEEIFKILGRGIQFDDHRFASFIDACVAAFAISNNARHSTLTKFGSRYHAMRNFIWPIYMDDNFPTWESNHVFRSAATETWMRHLIQKHGFKRNEPKEVTSEIAMELANEEIPFSKAEVKKLFLIKEQIANRVLRGKHALNEILGV